ncbi:hypothetical protein [Planctomicrobium piriforme]|nr:hypothetical protein [Planctomicrobium piriforme]
MSKPEVDEEAEEDQTVIGDSLGLLGVSIEAEEDEQEVTVTITCDAIMEPSSITCTLPEAGETYIVRPKIRYKYNELARQAQTTPITVTYEVETEDDAEEQSETLTLRSINDCPFGRAVEGEWTSLRFMFAAYVNEQHPFVDKVLREALDSGIVDSFTGYQSNDNDEVYRQVYALWNALSTRDVRYSSITNSVAESDSVGSQHIRLIDESINNGQANCVDGSVLLASLLRKVGIEPILVHVPGHCFLAFALNEEGTEIVGLETTLIGCSIEGDAPEVTGLEEVVDEELQATNSWKTFAVAIARGNASLQEHLEEFKDPENFNYTLISVANARKSGILSIGFQANQNFVDAPKAEEEDSEE